MTTTLLAVLFVLSLALFSTTALKRHRLDEALARAAATRGGAKPLDPPERSWIYDQNDLIAFIADARSQTIDGRNALDYYGRTILAWDMWFAPAFAIFIASADLLLADWAAGSPWVARAFLIFACLGVLYGVADLAEDFMLRKIFRHADELETMKTAPPAAAATADEAAAKKAARRDSLPADAAQSDAANALTRLKRVTIAASIVGGLVWLIIFRPVDRLLRKAAPAPKTA